MKSSTSSPPNNSLPTNVGSVRLRAAVLTASGTAGHGAEFARYMKPAELGAVVVKSMKVGEWAGNPSPRVHPTAAGMINSVGLQGKGVPKGIFLLYQG